MINGRGKKKAGGHFAQENVLYLTCEATFLFSEKFHRKWISAQTFGQKTPSCFRVKILIILDLRAGRILDIFGQKTPLHPQIQRILPSNRTEATACCPPAMSGKFLTQRFE